MTLICAYAHLIFFYKNPQGGCAPPPNVPKLGVSDLKNIAKTNIK